MGVKTKRCGEFHAAGVRFTLQNATYKGYVEHGRRSKGKTSEITYRKGEHEAIVSEEIFEQVQLKLEKSKNTKKKGRSPGHLLSNLLRCPECGSKMYFHVASRIKSDGTYPRYYVCSKYKKAGSCTSKTVNAEKMEDKIVNKIYEVVQDDSVIKNVVNQLNNGSTVDFGLLKNQIKMVEKEIAEFEKGKKNIMLEFSKGRIDAKVFNEMNDFTEEQLEVCRTKKQAIEKELIKTAKSNVSIENVKMVLSNFKEMFKRSEKKTQKRLIDSIVERIAVNDDRTLGRIAFRFEVSTTKIHEVIGDDVDEQDERVVTNRKSLY